MISSYTQKTTLLLSSLRKSNHFVFFFSLLWCSLNLFHLPNSAISAAQLHLFHDSSQDRMSIQNRNFVVGKIKEVLTNANIDFTEIEPFERANLSVKDYAKEFNISQYFHAIVNSYEQGIRVNINLVANDRELSIPLYFSHNDLAMIEKIGNEFFFGIIAYQAVIKKNIPPDNLVFVSCFRTENSRLQQALTQIPIDLANHDSLKLRLLELRYLMHGMEPAEVISECKESAKFRPHAFSYFIEGRLYDSSNRTHNVISSRVYIYNKKIRRTYPIKVEAEINLLVDKLATEIGGQWQKATE